MKHKSRQGKTGQRPPNKLLVQVRVQAIAPTPCQSVSHRATTPSSEISWEMRLYQNTTRMFDLVAQGIEKDRISQILWDEACREQDTIGVRIHLSMHVCSSCLLLASGRHVGEKPLMLMMTMAQLVGGAFLLVSNRQTEIASIAAFPVDIEEREILNVLRKSEAFHINLRDEAKP